MSLSNPIFSVDVDEQIELAQEFLPSFKPDRKTIEYLKKKEDESIADTQIFMNSCIPFIKELEIFLIKQRHNPIWPSTEIISSPSTYNINVYRTEDMAFNLLVRPKSYFFVAISLLSGGFKLFLDKIDVGFIRAVTKNILKYSHLVYLNMIC